MTDQEKLNSVLGKFAFSDIGEHNLYIRGNGNGVSGDHWVSCEFRFKDGKLIDMELSE